VTGQQQREGADVTIINTDGMSFIGPGSEWFWTSLGVIIAAVTLLGIYRQLRLQLGAGAIEQMETINKDFQSEQMSRARLAVLLALRDGTDAARIPPVANDIANFWERVGYLVRAGHVDRTLVNQYFDASIRSWWGWLEPSTRMARKRDDDPAIYENFEWLAGLMAEMDRKAGKTATFDEANRASLVPLYIERNREVIRIAEESRAVLVRPLSTASLAGDPAPSAAAD
jgi:hypothetical protein